MIVKIEAHVGNDVEEKIIDIEDDFENIENYDENYDNIVKDLKTKCRGVKDAAQVFKIFDDVMIKYDIVYSNTMVLNPGKNKSYCIDCDETIKINA